MTKARCKLVAYYRVSTHKQGASGLGMDAQRAQIDRYAEQSGCEVIASYTEVESGKRNDRAELTKALAHARRAKATLVIAKLDRLGRNVHFISGLMESGVDFVAADSPNDDRMMLHLRATFAEEERRKISERTKEALGAFKAGNRVSKRVKLMYPEGVPPEVAEATAGKLGASLPQCRNLTTEAQAKGAETNRDLAITAYALVVPLVMQYRNQGMSLPQIASKLNEEGRTTRTGAAWSPMQVKRVIDRAKANA